MDAKILLVDDEPHVLQAYSRILRRKFRLDVAPGGRPALKILAEKGPYAVLVSDMRMPEMDGVTLLKNAKQRFPQLVRIMLTGNADQQTAIDAINHGDIFRFLRKPCQPEELVHALEAGIEQHKLLTVEKTLLEETLQASIETLSEVLALVNPAAFGRATRVKTLAHNIGEALAYPALWELDAAALLSQIGCVTLPSAIIEKVEHGKPLSEHESRVYETHPGLGYDLVRRIPRLETVAECIRYQEKNYDGTGIPKDDIAGDAIPLGARLLKVILDYDRCLARGVPGKQAYNMLQNRAMHYDPAILQALSEQLPDQQAVQELAVEPRQLQVGMVLSADVKSKTGAVIIPAGRAVTETAIHCLISYGTNNMLAEPTCRVYAEPSVDSMPHAASA